jgi:hypothetical protein
MQPLIIHITAVCPLLSLVLSLYGLWILLSLLHNLWIKWNILIRRKHDRIQSADHFSITLQTMTSGSTRTTQHLLGNCLFWSLLTAGGGQTASAYHMVNYWLLILGYLTELFNCTVYKASNGSIIVNYVPERTIIVYLKPLSVHLIWKTEKIKKKCSQKSWSLGKVQTYGHSNSQNDKWLCYMLIS